MSYIVCVIKAMLPICCCLNGVTANIIKHTSLFTDTSIKQVVTGAICVHRK